MAEGHAATQHSQDYLAAHLVRYDELIPCTTAFIDTRTPGSQTKENFTIIGPGVAENPDQHVHIERPHGFNIGGARQPPGCVNSQHSHETAEVFVVHSGSWCFTTGENGTDGRVVIHPGDTISIPTRCFRGFENVGDGTGFLFAVLGGDDPGRVTWAPYVFENARDYGLVLLSDGSLIDTAAGETVPRDAVPMPVTTAQDVAALDVLDSDALERCVVRHDALRAQASPLADVGMAETVIIGSGGAMGDGPLDWPHGFRLHHLRLEAGAASRPYARSQEEVFLMQSGSLTLVIGGATTTLGPGDVFTAEINAVRTLANHGSAPCEAYVVHGTF